MTWSLVQQFGRVGIGALFYLAIARQLSPADIGIVGVGNVVLAFLGVFSELGFGAALIQRRITDPRHLDTVFALNLAVAAVLCVLGVALSWPVSRAMRVPAAQPVIAALSVTLLLTGASSVLTAAAMRELRFRALALRDLPAVTVGGVVGLACSLRGFGAWSLVAQTITTELAATALLWSAAPRRPSVRGWAPEVLPELWAFGSRLFVSNLFKYFIQNLDALMIGAAFGPAALGRYTLAQRLVTRPMSAVAAGVGAFLFPRAARAQDDLDEVSGLYAAAVTGLNYICLPVAALLGVWAGSVLPLFLGAQWMGLGSTITVVSLMSVAVPIITPLGQLMKALGRTTWLLWWAIGYSTLTLVALLVGIPFGLTGALTGLVIATAVAIVASLAVVGRLLPGRIGPALRAIAPSYACALVFLALVAAPRELALPPVAGAALGFALGISGLVLAVRVLDRRFAALVATRIPRRLLAPRAVVGPS